MPNPIPWQVKVRRFIAIAKRALGLVYAGEPTFSCPSEISMI
jgi:hypothetical protein